MQHRILRNRTNASITLLYQCKVNCENDHQSPPLINATFPSEQQAAAAAV
ncbi:hypothetical protein ALC62_03171 [Cyphomyrmex costatus]|uniref:Uncharacterized protein n=1 Tax=Cyphomyrmex costatus TaxID=456900 RepID=A0A151ILY6_9HYME|nr:hypothetical protein ALC62_03171 [Cyphomyrmex costatus]